MRIKVEDIGLGILKGEDGFHYTSDEYGNLVCMETDEVMEVILRNDETDEILEIKPAYSDEMIVFETDCCKGGE